MPDFNQVTAQIVALLVAAAPYFKDAVPYAAEAAKAAAQSAGKLLGEETIKKAQALLQSLRNRFQQDHNQKAEQTLHLFQDDPETFETALSKLLLQTLEQHPQWATEVQQLLADDAVQEIIATNESVVERITMQLTGRGTQRIKADKSRVSDVKMKKRES